jgi:antitoxin (DNA-binding transcriptional repressor) of toxin-antitoxin stability system
MEASLRELNVHASALARRAQGGETVTITDRGRPIADLGPHRAAFRFARKADVLRTFRGMAAVDQKQFRRDLDAVVDPGFQDPYLR